jgi:hypothetical protein
MPAFSGGNWFGRRLRRLQLRQNGFQRVEPWRIREGIMFERVPEMGHQRKLLVIGHVENHDRLDIAAASPMRTPAQCA